MTRTELAVSGFIRETEKLYGLSNSIPFELHQICHHFYTIPKAIFIKHRTKLISNGKSETIFKTINPFTNCVSKNIILHHSNTQMIQTDSLCYIPEFSNRINLGDEAMKQLNIDCNQESYDAFFAFIHVKIGYSNRCYPSFILFISDTIHDENNTSDIYAQLWISQREHLLASRSPNYNSKFIDNAIFSALADKKRISVLDLDNITNNNFEFQQKETNPIIKTQLFEPQEEVSYEETIDALLNGNCCIGVYDDKLNIWRSATFIDKSDKHRRITIRFEPAEMFRYLHPSAPPFMYDQWMKENSQMIENFKNLEQFPANNIRLKGYHATQTQLQLSHVPRQNIVKRLKHNKDNYNKKVSYNDKSEEIKYEFNDVLSLAMPQTLATNGQNLIAIIKKNTGAVYNYNLNRTEKVSFKGKEEYKLRSPKHIIWFDMDRNSLYAVLTKPAKDEFSRRRIGSHRYWNDDFLNIMFSGSRQQTLGVYCVDIDKLQWNKQEDAQWSLVHDFTATKCGDDIFMFD